MSLIQKIAASGAVVSGVVLSTSVQAASVLDAGMKTALSEGYGTLKDTVADVITTGWPFMLGIVCLMAAPAIAKKFFKSAVSS